jgi:membrane associated rhomboid family serine protease
VVITLAAIAATSVVSWSAFNNRRLQQRLVLWPPAVSRGREYWRLLTYGLVHADMQHLLFNMITLFFFGSLVEAQVVAVLGPLGYVGFYLGGLVAAIVPSYVAHRNDAQYVSLGASGAVSAVLFAFILMRPWATILVFVLPVPAILYAVTYVIYSIYMGRTGRDNINHSAHLWGGAWGVVFMLIMDPAMGPAFLQRLLHPGWLS